MKITPELLNAISNLNKENEVYNSFDNLYNVAVKYGAIQQPLDATEREKQKILHEGLYKIFCVIKFGDESINYFDRLLTKDLFLQYLKYDKKRLNEKSKSWDIDMNNIIRIEHLLNTNKAILEAQISINANVRKLYISGGYWNDTIFSDFKAAILTIDINKQSEYLKVINTLANEVLKLYDKIQTLPNDYNTIGGDTQIVLITREFDVPDIALYKDYFNGEKWVWRQIANTKFKVKSKIISDPKMYENTLQITNDIIYKDAKQIKSIIENIQPQPESDFDTSDKTNPLIFDYQLIVDLHRDFSNYLWNTIDIDNFKNCFRKIPKKLEFHKNITFPEICYFFGKIEYKETVVKPFSDWMVYHIGGNNYGKNKAEFNRIVKEAKDKRYNNSLTTPQQKAIENKQKIDTLFNQILSN